MLDTTGTPYTRVTQIDPLTGLATNDDAPIQGRTAISTSGRGFLINTTAAGNVDITFKDGSTMTMAVGLGHSFFPYAVTNVVASASSPATIATVYGAK